MINRKFHTHFVAALSRVRLVIIIFSIIIKVKFKFFKIVIDYVHFDVGMSISH